MKYVSAVSDAFSCSLFIVVIGMSSPDSPGFELESGLKGVVVFPTSSLSSLSSSSCSKRGSVSPKSAILNKISILKWKSVKKTKPNFEKKTSNALKADCLVHRVTFNPNRASPGEVPRVPVPKLDDGAVLVLGSLYLIFDLAVSGHANNYIVNNVARALVDGLTAKFVGEIV